MMKKKMMKKKEMKKRVSLCNVKRGTVKDTEKERFLCPVVCLSLVVCLVVCLFLYPASWVSA
jgi:hypothetical protein